VPVFEKETLIKYSKVQIFLKYILYVYLGSGTKKERRMARVYVISL